MTCYLISLGAYAMDHILDEDGPPWPRPLPPCRFAQEVWDGFDPELEAMLDQADSRRCRPGDA